MSHSFRGAFRWKFLFRPRFARRVNSFDNNNNSNNDDNSIIIIMTILAL